MEKLTIQEASRRLNISQRDIREYIRKGELKAERDPGSEHGRWLVVMPDDGWEDKFKTYLDELDSSITRWWWVNQNKTGPGHYLENMGIEEIMPDYLHLTPNGYQIWADAIEDKVKELLGES